MTLHLGLPHGHQRSTAQQQDIREARRMLKEKVRDDWDYPALPRYQPPNSIPKLPTEDRIAGFKFHHRASSLDKDPLVDGEKLGGLGFEPVEWREREYGSSEEASNEEAGDESFATFMSPSSKKTVGYQFAHLDDVGGVAPQPADQRLARKRKRRKQLEEELTWNDGLAHWMTRRDRWCAAHTSAEVDASRTPHEQQQQRELETDSASTSAAEATHSYTTSSSTPRSSTSSSLNPSDNPASSPASSISTAPSTSPSSSLTNNITSTPRPATAPTMLLPIPPPLLPTTHPIRSRLKPSLYPEIYTKIIQQARSPSVPINLHTLICALVQGWKDDGEWPPKPAGAVEKSIGRRTRKGRGGKEREDGDGGEGIGKVLTGVKAVGRVLRIGSSGGGGGEGVV